MSSLSIKWMMQHAIFSFLSPLLSIFLSFILVLCTLVFFLLYNIDVSHVHVLVRYLDCCQILAHFSFLLLCSMLSQTKQLQKWSYSLSHWFLDQESRHSLAGFSARLQWRCLPGLDSHLKSRLGKDYLPNSAVFLADYISLWL